MVDQQVVGHGVRKLTCSPTCSGNCYYSWFRQRWISDYWHTDGGYWQTSANMGCSATATVWIESTSSSDQDRYLCTVNYYIQPPSDCELGLPQWGVTYTPDSVCALEGSSVDLSCSYEYPGELRVTESFWFINEQHVDLREDDQYKGRVQYYQTPCRMRITNLRASDSQIYKFRFITDDPDDLKIEVSDTQEGVKQLNCSSTCTLTNPTYIWYRNEQPVSEQNRAVLYLRNRTVDAGSYSCAVKEHEEIRSAAVCVFEGLQVKVEGAAAAPAEGQTVTLTCSSMCSSQSYSTYTWYRNGQPVSECRSSSCSVAVFSGEISYSCAVEGSDLCSPPVYSPKETRAVIVPSGKRKEGDSVTLTCSSDADPPVLTFNWFKQSVNESLGTGQNYSITSISSQHSGLYYCTALNQLGQHSSAPARLDVFYPPRPPSLSEFNGFNGSITLVCVSDSNPASSYTWFRKTGSSSEPFRNGSNLTLAAGTGGVFYCLAENQYGSSNSSEWPFTSGV
ncbi:B-cell receptor CD22-like [Astyanax mexicanus]|uniref:B-cell receptor CD22-like n=1 Tax=Astyanax mexicanus TaxID=7994 RepID=A0A8T2LPC8_ASTMX|nr:B-cell receptor CD22-like [Astyanax mexicanus]